MKKHKLGKKDIFAPLEEVAAKEERKTKKLKKAPAPDTSKISQVRQTYYIRHDLIEKVKEYAFFEKTKISDVVNTAVEKYLKDYKPSLKDYQTKVEKVS